MQFMKMVQPNYVCYIFVALLITHMLLVFLKILDFGFHRLGAYGSGVCEL